MAPLARERRPPASSPGGGRHSGPEGRGGADSNRSGMAPSARERRPPVGTAARRAAAAQTPPGPGWRRPQGNADLRSAQRPGGPRRRRPHPVRDGAIRKGTPTSGRHSGPEGRGGADPTRSGMAPSARERRPPVGTAARGPRRRRPHPVRDGAVRKGTPTSGRHARERETCANDVRLCQRERRTAFAVKMQSHAGTPTVQMEPSARERRPPVGSQGRAVRGWGHFSQ